MTTKHTQSDSKDSLDSEQNRNFDHHEKAAEAHELAAEAHERAAGNLCSELTELAHAATHEASVAGGPTSPTGPLPEWFAAGFRASRWSIVAFAVGAGAYPKTQLRGHQEAAAAHRDAVREHLLLTVRPRPDEG